MAVSVEELMTPMTPEQVLALLIAILQGHGFPAQSWQSGSIERTLLEAFAQLLSEHTATTVTITKAGLNSTAVDGWLDLLSESHYNNTRLEGVKTKGLISIADTSGIGPHTLDAGEVVVTDAANGYRYRSTAPRTLGAGATLPDFEVEAELVGHEQNLANNTITVLVEGPPGATVNNPSASWITVEGAGRESNAALQQRNVTKWAQLGAMGPAAAYEFWARESSAVVTRVYVDDQNPRGPGTLDLYLAGAGGTVTDGASPLVTGTVSDYILGITDGIRRAGIGANLLVKSAVARAVTLTGTVYYLPTADAAVVEAAVEATLTAFFEELPIGGTKTDDPDQGRLLLGSLYSRILSVTSVVNVSFSSPSADLNLAANEVVVAAVGGLVYSPAVF